MTVSTTLGTLEHREFEEGNQLVVEYRLNGELIHRSVTITLRGLQAASVAARI
jgi:hypothetical protein